MQPTEIPTEVELLYQLKPCADEHSALIPGKPPLPCAYFRKWGTWHSFDYASGQPMTKHTIKLKSEYAGRRPLVAEALSGCRKAPILAVGINPNLPAWWHPNAANPLFNEVQEYAHYFRYRAIDKLRIPAAEFVPMGGDLHEPHQATGELTVPPDASGRKIIPLESDPVSMYEGYAKLLGELSKAMGWPGDKLAIGDDLAYGNMVACPSAKWLLSREAKNPDMPPMTRSEMNGIVDECWEHRSYFLRQLVQSLPSVLLVFSQSTTDAFIGQMQGNFTKGDPKLGDKVADLLEREVRIGFEGLQHSARVIFSPHITGNPTVYEKYKPKVIAQLVDEAQNGGLSFNPETGHLARSKGLCTLCPSMAIGDCDYAAEIQPHSIIATITKGEGEAISQTRLQKRREMDVVKGFLARNAAVREVAKLTSLAKAEPLDGWAMAAEHALEDTDLPDE